MAEVSSWRVRWDYPQSRVQFDAQTVLAQGGYPGIKGGTALGWDAALSSDVYVDPVTFTLFRRPGPWYEAWNTTGTGIYERLAKSDFSLSSPSAWEDDPTAFSTDYWLRARDLTAAQSGVTTATWPEDTGFWVGYYLFNDAKNEYEALRVGWGATADYLTGTSARIFSSGRVEVWRDGALVGAGDVSGSQAGAAGGQEYVGLMLLPCRGNELLLVGTGGKGFTVVFDLEDGNPVVPSSPFWFEVPQLGTKAAKVQIANLQYKASGVAVSALLSFAEPPQATQVQGFALFADGPGTTTVTVYNADGSGPFLADGVERDCRVRVDLSGTSDRTQSLYAATGEYAMEFAPLGSLDVDATDFVQAVTLSVGEAAESVSCEIDLARIDGLEAAGVVNVRGGLNRAVIVERVFGGVSRSVVIGGRSEPVEWDAGVETDLDDPRIVLKDRWKALETYTFREPYPLDGLTFARAVAVLVEPSGVSGDRLDVESTGFVLPKGSGMSRGEYSFLIDVGDKASEGLRRLFDAFAPDWYYGFVPFEDGTRFVARSPAGLGTTPVTTLYLTTEDALASLIADGFSDSEARKLTGQRTCKEYRERSLEPEANVVYVTGWDARRDAPIQAFKEDRDSSDPTLAVVDRPDNWIGERRPYGYLDPALNSQALVERACEALFRKLSVRRVLAEVSCEALWHPTGRPVWRGETIRIEGAGDYRVQSFAWDLTKANDWESGDPYGQWQSCRARYTLEKVNPARDSWRGSSLLPGLDMAVASQDRRRASRVRPPAELISLVRRGPFARYEV